MNSTFDICSNCGKEGNWGCYPIAGYVCSLECYKAKMVPYLIKKSGLDEDDYQKKRLDNFRFHKDELKKRIYDYLEKPDKKGWAFIGDNGTGKSHLATGIAIEMIERHLTKTKIISTPELMGSLFANMNNDGGVDRLMSKYKNIDLLVLDDLGAEKSSEYAVQQLFLVIDHRLRNKKLTFITSNYSIKDLSKYVSQRIASRILEMCRVEILSGGDYRLKIQKDISG